MAGHNLFKASFRIARGLLLASLILLLAGCAGFDAVKDSSGKETSQAITLPYEQSGSDPTGADPTGERQKVPVPVITAPDAIECVVLEGDAASFFDPLQNVSATDENGKSYPVASEGDYDLAKAGEYVLTFSAAADDGSKVTRTAVLTVVSPFDADGNMLDGVYKTARGYELVIENGIATVDGYMIVNKSYTVPKGFSSTGDGSRDMRKEAMEAWYAMRAAAPDNIKQNLKIKSGVRNISDQTIIFNNYVKNRGLENALTFSAKPRHSEHHTGLAMDITVSGRTDGSIAKIRV